MALVACKECGNQISEAARACPHCGAAVGDKPAAGVDLSSVNFRGGAKPSHGASVSGSSVRSGETGLVSGFERKVLFRIARFVAFTICLVLFLAMVGGLIFMGTTMSGSNKPDAAGLVQELKPGTPSASSGPPSTAYSSGDDDSTLGQRSALTGLRVAPELQELMNQGENKSVLDGWVSGFDQVDRQPFVDGLGQAISEARKQGVSDAEALNAYHQRYQEYVAEREVSRLASMEAKLYVAGGVISILLLLALFSLVLVLLAIERNTYRSANLVQQQ